MPNEPDIPEDDEEKQERRIYNDSDQCSNCDCQLDCDAAESSQPRVQAAVGAVTIAALVDETEARDQVDLAEAAEGNFVETRGGSAGYCNIGDDESDAHAAEDNEDDENDGGGSGNEDEEDGKAGSSESEVAGNDSHNEEEAAASENAEKSGDSENEGTEDGSEGENVEDGSANEDAGSSDHVSGDNEDVISENGSRSDFEVDEDSREEREADGRDPEAGSDAESVASV